MVGEEFCVVVVIDRGVDFSVFKPQPDVEPMSANTHHFIWSSWLLFGFFGTVFRVFRYRTVRQDARSTTFGDTLFDIEVRLLRKPLSLQNCLIVIPLATGSKSAIFFLRWDEIPIPK